MRIPLIKPFLPATVGERVLEVLASGYLTEGKVTAAFEHACREYLGASYCLAMTSCTVGLEAVLRYYRIGPGDEVIVPDYTYPATADVVAIVGADIVIVDVDPETMLIDYEALEKAITSRTRAVIPVSLFGNPLDYDRLAAIKKNYGIAIIEDAACAFGAEFRGRKVGSFADFSVFSLHPRKFITTGEGGLITTAFREGRDWLVSYKHFGLGQDSDRQRAVFQMIGTNYKMSDVLAAIGLAQMEYVHELLARRRELAATYIDLLSGVKAVSLPRTTRGGEHSYQTFCVLVANRDRVFKRLRAAGIEVQIGTYCLHQHPAFNAGNRCLIREKPVGSQYVGEHCLALPLYHELSRNDQEEVVERLVAC
ncbi:MAG: DegT/DnrJ/EryC1/StrS family aminotransferase [Deltaproteobacteria bacterium]|nr:DegT/DnrJ/EryC1/StrS family aminotransferase [Deltaproteobacteria bacterium]